VDSIESLFIVKPRIVITVDWNKDVEEHIRRERSDLEIYRSESVCGWGAGMYKLLCEALSWYINKFGFDFDFLLNMDYDLIFTEREADKKLLSNVDGSDNNVGLWGKYVNNSPYWQAKVKRSLPRLIQMLRERSIRFPFQYRIGEHVAGACSLLSRECLEKFYSLGFANEPFRSCGYNLRLADDPLLSFFVKASGFSLGNLDNRAYIAWKETDYEKWFGKCYLFHPTKLLPGSGKWSIKSELDCRNFWRSKRGRPPMNVSAVGMAGPLSVKA